MRVNSSRSRVFLTRKLFAPAMNLLRGRVELRVWPGEEPPPKEVLIREVRDVDGLLCLAFDRIDADVINAGRNLKVISQVAVGYDNIDVEAATQRGIYVTNTPGVLTETVADLTWAILLAAARRVVEADRCIRRGGWTRPWFDVMLGSDVYGKTLGIVGLGRIGSAVARRARGFNMKILYYSRTRKPKLERELNAKYVDLDTLLRESDFVTLHVPLTRETYHMIGERELRLMKPTAFLINTARGAVVDEKALYRALKEGWIRGAALDVYEREPISPDHPLLKLENVVLTPHIGSATAETRVGMAVLAVKNLLAALEGEVPPNLVNPEVLEVRRLRGEA